MSIHAHPPTGVTPEGSVIRALAAAAIALAVATAAGIALLWPGDAPATSEGAFGTLYDARVEDLRFEDCARGTATEPQPCLRGLVRVLEGPDRDEVITLDLPVGLGAPDVNLGDGIVVAHYTNPEAVEAGVQYQFAELDRKPALLWLGILFAVAVVLLGRLRGLAALAGLGAGLLVLVKFVLPAILEGRSPVLVAVVGAAAIAFVALYSAHGFGAMTTVALLGTLAALALTLGLGSLFNEVARLSGLASEEATLLQFNAGEVDFAGILLAGLVIGALGAIDDVTVTQASAVWELRAADPAMSRASLLRSGMRIGRDHVASAVNTLVLAYAGASMALMLLFVLSGRSFGQVANGEIVAAEIVRTLVGSIGLVASVPITTWLAAVAAPAARPAAPAPESAP